MRQHELDGLGKVEGDKKLHENAEFLIELFEKLDYDGMFSIPDGIFQSAIEFHNRKEE